MKKFKLKYFEEINIPAKKDLDPSLKPFIEKKLKEDKNIVNLFVLIFLSIYLTTELAPYAKWLVEFTKKLVFIDSPFVSSFIVIFSLSTLIVIVKKSTHLKLYKAPDKEGEKLFWVQRLSKYVAGIFSVLIAAFFEILRFLLLDSKTIMTC